MLRVIKFELYRLLKERFWWVLIVLILIINFVMLSGTTVTLEGIVQKSFITMMIASLYPAFYVGSDCEKGRTIHLILSGSSRFKIAISKLMVSILGAEVLILIFPCIEIFVLHRLNIQQSCVLLLSYTALGVFLGTLGTFFAWIFKNAGYAVGGVVIFHLCSLFLMNSKKIGKVVMNVLPIGITKLAVESNIQIYSIVSFAVWNIMLIVASVYIFKHSDL